MTRKVYKGEFELISNTYDSEYNSNVYETVHLIGNENGFTVLTFKGRYAETPILEKHFTNINEAVKEFKNQNAYNWAIKKVLEEVMIESGLCKKLK